MKGSRDSTAHPAPKVIIVDDDDDCHTVPDSANHENTCKKQVLSVLDDICPLHLDMLAKEHAYDAGLVLAAIMDKQEKGEEYPRQGNPLKRKWEGDSDDDNEKAKDKATANLQAKIDDPLYAQTMQSQRYKNFAVQLISQDFAMAPKVAIKKLLSENGSVLRTYAAMEDARRAGNDAVKKLWMNKKFPTPALPTYAPENIAAYQRDDSSQEELAALDEFLAARASRDRKDALMAEEANELANIEQAKSQGKMRECGCCFDDFPLNRMVHCSGDKAHSFCRDCMTQHAETTVGYQKYELTCMSMDGCDAGFSVAERATFLDKKLQMALDRIEQQAMLAMAGLEDLETCPFCPYAMEYPPVAVNKEFRCENPTCRRVSCRLCRKSTHIPKSCAEAARDEAHDVRHTIEEAMSEAMIRKCNKCKNPFIKQDGCNKISCTRCRTLHCYICRQTVKDYSHFNDVSRGGKPGQCPLFDATEERHQNEVQRAEEEMRKKVTEERPDLVGDVLNFKVSSAVEEDDEKRKQSNTTVHRRFRDFNAAVAHFGPQIIHRRAPMVVPMPPALPNVRGRPEDARPEDTQGAGAAHHGGRGQPPVPRLAFDPIPAVRPALQSLPRAWALEPQWQPDFNHMQNSIILGPEAENDYDDLLQEHPMRHMQNSIILGPEAGNDDELLQEHHRQHMRNSIILGPEAGNDYDDLLHEHPMRHIPFLEAILPQAAQPQAARPQVARPPENQSEAARYQAMRAYFDPFLPQHGALADPMLPHGQPLDMPLLPPGGPAAVHPGLRRNPFPMLAQQAQQNRQVQALAPMQPDGTKHDEAR